MMKHSILSRSPASKKLMHNSPGFTLVELMLVIVISVILMVVAIPNFEALVYGPSSNRATLELMGILQQARMKAIKTHLPVTVVFNQPGVNQVTATWTENGVARSKVHNLNRKIARVSFNPTPPGAAPPPPDTNFIFTSMGFIQPNAQNRPGNIYLMDTVNNRHFNITTTIAGGIIERKWDGSVWNGPTLTIP